MDYENKLKELNNACNEAKQGVIVCETNIKNLEDSLKDLSKECNDKLGLKVEDLPAYIENKKKEIDGLLSLIEGINLSDINNLSDEDLKKLTEISFKATGE
jgi:hypothetical protein